MRTDAVTTSRKSNRRPPGRVAAPKKAARQVVAKPGIVLSSKRGSVDQVQTLRAALKTAQTRLKENTVEMKRNCEHANDSQRDFRSTQNFLNKAVIGLERIVEMQKTQASAKPERLIARIFAIAQKTVEAVEKRIK